MTRRATTLVVALAALMLIAAAAPDDPYYPQQWNLEKVRAAEAWTVTEGQGIVVAVIDSGVDLSHPDLASAIARRPDGSVLGRDLVDDDDDPTDEHGHGTMVAGLVAARTGNGTGVASLAPRASIMPVRVLDEDATGTSQNVDEAIRWAADNGADVINLSLEVADEEGGSDPTLPIGGSDDTDDAVRYAWERGVAVVAAAGNDSAAFTDYSSDTPVLIVGATNRDDARAGFSDTGRRDAVMAPGMHIVSTWCDPCGQDARHAIGMSEGTSYAAPQVSALVALLRATGMSSEQAVRRIRDTAVDVGAPGPDQDTGQGRIDAAAALGVDTTGSPSENPDGTPPPSSEPSPDQQAAGSDPPSTPSEPTPSDLPTPSVAPSTPGPDTSEPDVPSPRASDGSEPPLADAGGSGGDPVAAWSAVAGAMIIANLGGLLWVARPRTSDVHP
ncbi:MAG: S8 family serine peptidase [Actinobacteria bacterium]|nr:S8 family serine peptidase [Actinomycetota bacterium]